MAKLKGKHEGSKLAENVDGRKGMKEERKNERREDRQNICERREGRGIKEGKAGSKVAKKEVGAVSG